MKKKIMKIKKILLTVMLFAGVLSLAACSGQPKSTASSSHKAITTAVKSKKKSKASPKKTTSLWNESKDTQLKTFIDRWAPTMKQTYVKYDGKKSLKVSTGMVYPDDLSKTTVEGNQASIGFSKNGDGKYAYDVVAIYNYDGTVPPLPNHITYFFAFQNGQPIVLVDQSRDGAPNLIETKNTQVKDAFANIVAGKKATVDSNTDTSQKSESNNTQVSDPKMIGVMVHQLAMPGDDVTKEATLGVYTANSKYWIGIGTSTSNVGYTINGDTVTYYTKDGTSGDSTATEDLISHTVSLNDLEKQYYSTDAQKQTVQSVAGNMPAIENQDE